MRGNILRSYRELLTLLRRLPTDAQLSASREAKAKIRAHREETDSLKITDLHKQLVAKLSFLRMTTNRRQGERHQSSSGTFVLREGELVESASEREHRWFICANFTTSERVADNTYLCAEQRMDRSVWMSLSSVIISC